MIDSDYNGVTDFIIVEKPNSLTASTPNEPLSAIGKMGCYNGSEIGLMLHPAYWGKGYASEAAKAVIDHIWTLEDNNLMVIMADVDPRNDACLRLLTGLGFVETGRAVNTFETHLGWVDSVYLGLNRPADKPVKMTVLSPPIPGSEK
jgi:[ribosomal protein S5]-alanine N-acetyltransferase